MNKDESYMARCLELAKLGLGDVQPNPMVGAVIVHNGEIIGEGYHRQYGQPHAEVNAINSVKDQNLLRESTIYVSLEPCSHFGKTPPCADKIIELGIPKVVIGTTDPHDKVDGRGIQKLRDAGIEVVTNVLEAECRELNRRFFTYHQKHRPYIILKWAQTADGFMDIVRPSQERYWITNEEMRVIVHKWRSEEQAILIGYNTYLNDHPQLNTRLFTGKSPRRYLMARNPENVSGIEGFRLLPDHLENALATLYGDKVQSVIVEGGRKTLDLFISSGLWDEARVLTGTPRWGKGTPAPQLQGEPVKTMSVVGNAIRFYRNKQ